MARGKICTDEQIVRELTVTRGNVSEAARILGITDQGLRKRIDKNLSIKELVGQIKEEVRIGKITEREQKREELRRFAKRDYSTDEMVYQALLKHDGDVIEAANELEVHPGHLRKRIAKTPALMDAMLEGESYKILQAEKRYKDIAMGKVSATTSERQALADYVKCKAGWTPKTAVKHEVLNYDFETVPMEDVAPDLPSKH